MTCDLNCDDGTLEYHDPNGTSAIQTYVSVAPCPNCTVLDHDDGQEDSDDG